MALDRINMDYELVGWSEIDKYAIKAHNAVYPQYIDRNYGDIRNIDWENVPDFELFTYSFPCQSISIAGAQEGFVENSGTKSSVLWECRKAVKAKRPKYLLMENVKALVSDKFLPAFKEWQDLLETLGYRNYTAILNSKDYGIPQSRERVFMVSILDSDTAYEFPEPLDITPKLISVLEDKVDDKYYLSQKMLDYFSRLNLDWSHHHKFKPKSKEDIAFTVTSKSGSRVDDNFIKEDWQEVINRKQHHINGISVHPISHKLEFKGKRSIKEIAPTLRATDYKCPHCLWEDQYCIRKCTPRENFRLMGVKDSDIDKIQAAKISNTQQYKLAGNSIVVDLLAAILKNLLQKNQDEEERD